MKRARVTVNHREDKHWRQVDNYPRKRSDRHVAATPILFDRSFSLHYVSLARNYVEENDEIDFQHAIVQSSNLRAANAEILAILLKILLLLPLLGRSSKIILVPR